MNSSIFSYFLLKFFFNIKKNDLGGNTAAQVLLDWEFVAKELILYGESRGGWWCGWCATAHRPR